MLSTFLKSSGAYGSVIEFLRKDVCVRSVFIFLLLPLSFLSLFLGYLVTLFW